MRKIFIQKLVKEASKNKKIVLIVGDLGYGIVESFKKKFPKRFFNAGVAEQSMAGLAAGLALKGFHPFIYSIANFPTFRCAEQLRNDMVALELRMKDEMKELKKKVNDKIKKALENPLANMRK